MKRFLAVFAALLLAVVLCCSVGLAAAPTSYYLEEIDADIALPPWDDYYFLYPDMPADNADLGYLELTPQDINDILVPNGILFDALYYDGTHEIAVQVNDEGTDGVNYHELSEAERRSVITTSTMELELMGYTVNTMEWQEGESAVWLVVEFTHPDIGWAYQYHTSFDGKTLVFTASSGQGAELTDEIRAVTANMALGTVFRGGDFIIDEPAPSPYEPESGGSVDMDALKDALGLTEEDMEALAQGSFDFNDLDLSAVNVEALVNAFGMTEQEVIELIERESDLGDVDLSGLDLSASDLGALVEALGLTGDDLNRLARGEMDPGDLDLSGIDPLAVVDALGLTEEELIDIAMSAAGAGDLDWPALLRSAGRGALIGFAVGAAVVALIIVVLAVTGRKKVQKVETQSTTGDLSEN